MSMKAPAAWMNQIHPGGGATPGYIAPRQLSHSDSPQATRPVRWALLIMELIVRRRFHSPSAYSPLSEGYVCPVPSPKATFSTSNSSSYRVGCFFTVEDAPGGLYMGGVIPGPGPGLPAKAGYLPARASFFGVKSLSLVLADFGTLLFFVLLFIFILSFLFC